MDTFRSLCRNVEANQLEENVWPIRQALASGERRRGVLASVGVEAADRATLLGEEGESENAGEFVFESVNVSSLDAELADGVLTEFVAGGLDLVFVKVDCEGGEMAVLEGGAELWKQVPEVVVMVEDLWGSAVVDWLSSSGWRRLEGNGRHNSFWTLESRGSLGRA